MQPAIKGTENMEKLGAAIERTDPAIVGLMIDAIVRRTQNDESATDVYEGLLNWQFKLNGRANSRYGQCQFRARTIEIHERLVDHPVDYRMTLIHEVAHAIDYLCNGRADGHGRPWQAIMRDLGEKPIRQGAHTKAAADAVRQQAFKNAREVWECQKCGEHFPVVRKRKYPAEKYSHNKCGGKFAVVE